ncbi:MAG TPA: hypothetical protein VF633_06470 [Brevundimonas sp.]
MNTSALTTARFLALISLGALATACSTTREADPTPMASGGAPQPIRGYDWFFHPEATEAKLVYGVETSDDLRLGLTCEKGSGRVEITANAPHGVREIYLESGGETERFRAEGEASELADGDFLTAEATTAAPVFQRFRRVGWLAQWNGEKRETYVPHPATAPTIDRFFAFCG